MRARATSARALGTLAAAIAIPAAATLAIAIPAPASGKTAHTAGTHTVTLKSLRFHPGTLTIKRGESVTWKWGEHLPHNVSGSGFKSKTQSSGSFTARFTKRGTFNYVCTIHVKLGMRGKIVVR
ncbi:MAG: plastocyanin/azurin family copper-binding protein [Solirubrobacterales bacterium]|nr:plastocyanin/azurin family copper-binding protein [Solirubrobacterales bacterium]